MLFQLIVKYHLLEFEKVQFLLNFWFFKQCEVGAFKFMLYLTLNFLFNSVFHHKLVSFFRIKLLQYKEIKLRLILLQFNLTDDLLNVKIRFEWILISCPLDSQNSVNCFLYLLLRVIKVLFTFIFKNLSKQIHFMNVVFEDFDAIYHSYHVFNYESFQAVLVIEIGVDKTFHCIEGLIFLFT